MPKFRLTYETELIVDIDQSVLDRVYDEGWQEAFYTMHCEEDVVEMIASALDQGWSLADLDGWADMDSKLVCIEYRYSETPIVEKLNVNRG